MKDMGNTYFDEALDGFVNIPEGTYPAHLLALEVIPTKKEGLLRFQSTFKLAEEVSELIINKVTKVDAEFINVLDADGNEVMINGSTLVGKTVKNNCFVTANPIQGEGWRNRKYIDFFTNLGVQFPEVEGKTKVMEIEESDVIGAPTLVTMNSRQWEGQKGMNISMEVSSNAPWADGVRLDPSELDSDIPF